MNVCFFASETEVLCHIIPQDMYFVEVAVIRKPCPMMSKFTAIQTHHMKALEHANVMTYVQELLELL